MRIFFDENFSHFLSKGISHFQEGRRSEDVEVFHIAEFFDRGIADDKWIPKVASMHGIVITQDLNIHRTRYLKELCDTNKIGIFFFKPPSKKGYMYWEWVVQVVNKWDEIKKISKNTNRPFSFQIKPRTTKFIQL